MADRTRFGERLAALLEPRRRRGVLDRRTALPAVLAAALAVSVVAAVEPTRRATAPEPPAPALAEWARAAEKAHGPAPAAASVAQPAPRPKTRPASSSAGSVAVYRAPAVRIVLSGGGDRVELVPGGGVEGDPIDTDGKSFEACDPGESHDSSPRPEPAVRPVQVAARSAEVTAH